jgi:processing peptidase subunit beta
MGAHLNAFTSREMTIYHMQVVKAGVPHAVDILGDMLLHSLYKETSLEAEKDTITQELDEVNKDPMEVLLENVHFNVVLGAIL